MAGRTGRPNKNRKESKYLLPSGVTLKPGQASVYNKTTELIFIDEEFENLLHLLRPLPAVMPAHILKLSKDAERLPTPLSMG